MASIPMNEACAGLYNFFQKMYPGKLSPYTFKNIVIARLRGLGIGKSLSDIDESKAKILKGDFTRLSAYTVSEWCSNIVIIHSSGGKYSKALKSQRQKRQGEMVV